MSDDPSERRLGEALAALGSALLIDDELKGDLDRIVHLAVRLIPDASGASVSMLVLGEATTMAVTDRVSLQVDMVQYSSHEGPCITALGGHVVRIGFVDADDRFPRFAAGAADLRVKSVMSTPAVDHGMIVGSINVYSQEREAFDDATSAVTTVLAAEVANAIVKSVTLRTAMRVRDDAQRQHDEQVLVARAQGVLMAIEDCSAAQAGNLIRNAARDNGEELITTAERILANVLSDHLDPVEPGDAAPTVDQDRGE